MKNLKLFIIIIACANIFAACKKDKTTTEPADQLPPATQTGANTFGCLVNGKVWIPKGYNGMGSPNPNVKVETGNNGLPVLTLDTKQFNNTVSEGTLFLSIGNLDFPRIFTYPADMTYLFGWSKYFGNCNTPAFDTTVKKWGGGIISKLDLSNKIISGTFYCKFKAATCDTVFITDGRFDIKF